MAALRFDVRVGPDASCSQIWWFPDHPTSVAMIHASDLDEDVLDEVTRLVDSAEALS